MVVMRTINSYAFGPAIILTPSHTEIGDRTGPMLRKDPGSRSLVTKGFLASKMEVTERFKKANGRVPLG